MAYELAVAYVNLVPSAKGMRSAIEKELNLDEEAEKQGGSAGKKFSAAFNKENAKKLEDAGKKMLLVATAVGAGVLGVAQAAGNLEAAIAANEQVLGSASRVAREWAKGSVEAVGLSERAALEATTSFGGLGKILGLAGQELAGFSIEMTRAAADMAAFKDVPVDEALADLQSGFAGQTEVMRKYNIFLDDASLKAAYFRATGEKVTGTLTAQQRVLVTHAEIMRQGADMWGRWDRESDGLAATQSKLKAELENMAASVGASVLPQVTALLGVLADGLGVLVAVNDATGGLVATLGLAGAGMLAVGGSVVYLSGKVTSLITSWRTMGTMSRTLAVGMGLLTAATALYAYNQQQAAQRAQQFSRFAEDAARAGAGQLRELITRMAEAMALQARFEGTRPEDTFANLARESLGAAINIRDAAAGNAEYAATLEAAGLTVNEMTRAIEAETKAQAKAKESTDQAASAVENLTSKWDTSTIAAQVMTATQEAIATATEQYAERTEQANANLQESLDNVGAGFREAADAAEGLSSAIDAVFNPTLDLDEATQELVENAEKLRVSFKDNGATLDLFSEKGRANRDVVREQARSILEYGSVLVASGKSNEEAAFAVEGLRLGLIDQMVQAGLTREAAEGYLATLGLTPDNIVTAIELANAEAARQTVQDHLDKLGELPPDVATELQALIDTEQFDEAERRIKEVQRLAEKGARLAVQATTETGRWGGLTNSLGSFVPGGSNLISSLGEIPGRRGDEVVLPLGLEQRMNELVNHPRARGPILRALDLQPVPAAGPRTLVENLYVTEGRSILQELRLVDALYGAS